MHRKALSNQGLSLVVPGGGKETARPSLAGYYKAQNLVVPAPPLAICLSPIPGDNPVHIAAHYAKTVYSINPLPDLLHF